MFGGLRSSPAASIGPALWRSDQYYWFTAVLAARGLQAASCRLVAVCIVVLGLIPVALMTSRHGPQGTHSRIIAVAIGVSCLAMAMVWLRHHWPTRAQSLACVVVGTFAIGICRRSSCPTHRSGSSAPRRMSCSRRIRRLLPRRATAGADLDGRRGGAGVLFVRQASVDLTVWILSLGVVVLLNVFVAFACRAVIKLIQPDAHHGDIEQLTGLLHRDAFYRGVATLLASRSRSDDKYLVVVAVNIDSFSLLLGLTGSGGGNRARSRSGRRCARPCGTTRSSRTSPTMTSWSPTPSPPPTRRLWWNGFAVRSRRRRSG